MSQRLALIGNQMLEDVEFLWSEVYFMAADRQLRVLKIQCQLFRNKKWQRLTGSVSSQSGTNSRQRLFDTEGLVHIIVRPGIDCEHFVALRVSNREHDDR